jgi:3-deoxy-D-manno-octulosonic-acid transferase
MIFSFLFYLIYHSLLTIAYPFIWLLALKNEKLHESQVGQSEIFSKLQTFRSKITDDTKPIVWLHAASAGEFEQIKPLLEAFSLRDVYIYQTFTSGTIYYKAFRDPRFHGVSFLPWDFPWRVSRFINILKPKYFINTRHDLWPNILYVLNRKKIPSILINANLYKSSMRLKPWFKPFNAVLFNQISHLFTVSSDVAELIQKLYTKEIMITGDTRFDQVINRAEHNEMVFLGDDVVKNRPIIIYGSVIETDLEIISHAISKLDSYDAYFHVIVPHEVSERDIVPIEVELYRLKLASFRKTELHLYHDESILIWNSVGELADLYKFATLAYIGAGFSTGVHSVAEPSVYCVPSAHGPHYDLLAEAIELIDLGISTLIRKSDDLTDFIRLIASPELIDFKKYVSERKGATQKILKALNLYSLLIF